MDQDHYAVLGVEPTADQVVIRAAYWRLAKQCHPDRGGSHAQMKRLNEAWYVLSDPERRLRFDAVRNGRADARTQARSREEATAAQAAAAEYPRDWGDFERWFASVVDDFAQADYSEDPRARRNIKSRSGELFRTFGIWLGAVLGLWVFFTISAPMQLRIYAGLFTWAAASLFGKGLHYLVRCVLMTAQLERRRLATSAPPSSQKNTAADNRNNPFHFIRCQGCGRTLRLPAAPPSDVVKCPACGKRFSLSAAR